MNGNPKKMLFALLVGMCVTSPAAQFKFESQTLTVPDGFEVNLVAGTNLAQRPGAAKIRSPCLRPSIPLP